MINAKRGIAKVCLAGGVVLSMMGVLRSPSVASQEVCEGTDFEAPAATSRTIKFQEYGLQVKIPSNFRPLERDSGTWILDPGTFNLLQCTDQGIPGPGRGIESFEIIRRRPNPQKLSAKEFALQVDDSHLSPEVMSHRIGDLEIYSRAHDRGGIEISYAWFQGSGGNEIIELSTQGTQVDLLALLNRVESMPIADGTLSNVHQSNDPIEIAIKALREGGGSFGWGRRREIIAEHESLENPQRSVVTITEEGFMDDSVKGHRYILQLQKDPEGKWAVTDIQKSWVCRLGRGSQVYAQKLCH